jgi:hypothetical protein
MGFASQKYRRDQQQRRWKIHPVWRGIGCALILLIPIMSWYAATLFLKTNRQIALPWDLTKPVTIRYSQVPEIDRVIADFNRYTISHNLVVGQFFFTIIIMFLGFGILSMVYAFMYQIAGPPRYGPLDVPPTSMRR